MHSLWDILKLMVYHYRRSIWSLRRPPLPRNPDGRVYVHIGAGPLYDKRFINIDIQPFKTIHYLSDGRHINLPSFSVDLIYASHVIEHFSHRETEAVLSEWHRLLKPQGEILISVPDCSKLFQIYNHTKDIDAVKIFLMGSQGNLFDFHYSIFDITSLTKMLEHVGFVRIKPWAVKDYSDYPFDDYAHYEPTKTLSLSLKAHKSTSGFPA